ncbi:DUF302 domain-containing protein [Cupriavidus sp. TA19]|nr:DUF302 domain-containing protein [Cupriavidus sp. TA19]
MPPKQVLIYGNARRGTPLMLAAPSVALDLPCACWCAMTARAAPG